MKAGVGILMVVVLTLLVLQFVLAVKYGVPGVAVLWAVIFVWLIASLKIVGPDEMAVLVAFGVPVAFRDSGFRFVLFLPGCYLRRFPKKVFNFDYSEHLTVSMAEIYKGKSYGALPLKVDSVAYIRFPRGQGLIEILRSQVPTDEATLKGWTEEAVVSALREALGRITWRESMENLADVRKTAEKIFKDEDGALLHVGFHPDDIRLVITEIKLPDEIVKALPKFDQARIEAEAAENVARSRAMEAIGTVVESMAIARGRTVEEMQQLVDGDKKLQREFLDAAKDLLTRTMAINSHSFVDIRVDGAKGMEASLLNLLAAWQRMPTGGSGGGEPQGEQAVEAPATDTQAVSSGHAAVWDRIKAKKVK